MLTGLLWLLGCQLVGETIARVTGLPVPGPVLGMVVLFGVLQWSRSAEAAVTRSADILLRHLQLLFVPAGVGVVAYLGVVRAEALPLLGALVGSWLVGLVVVGWVAQGLGRLRPGRGRGEA